MKAEVSIVAASWTWEPEDMVAKGDIRTSFSRVVVVGVVDVDVGVGVVGVDVVAAAAAPPMTDFSPIMHPVPIFMGPSYERTFARGWNTVPAPIVIG